MKYSINFNVYQLLFINYGADPSNKRIWKSALTAHLISLLLLPLPNVLIITLWPFNLNVHMSHNVQIKIISYDVSTLNQFSSILLGLSWPVLSIQCIFASQMFSVDLRRFKLQI